MEEVKPILIFAGETTHPCRKALKELEEEYKLVFCPTFTEVQSQLNEPPTLLLFPLDSPLVIRALRVMLPTALPFVGLATAQTPPEAITQALEAAIEQVVGQDQWHVLPILVRRLIRRAAQRQQQLETRRSLQAFLMDSKDPIMSYDPTDQRWTFVNHALLDWLGYASFEEWEHASLSCVLPEGVLVYPKNNTPVAQMCQLCHKNGLPLEATAQPLVLNGLKGDAAIYWKLVPTYPMGCQVSACNHGQADLLINHAEQVPGVIYQFQLMADERIVFPFVSDRLGEISAVPVDELRQNGNIIFQYMHPDDVTTFLRAGYHSRATMTIWSLDYRLQAKDGAGYVWIHGSSKPVSLPDGSALWYGYLEDITEAKEAEAALRNSEEQARTLFEHAPDAIAILDAYGKVTQWNPQAEDLFGWASGEIIGQFLYDFIAPEHNRAIYRRCLQEYREFGGGMVLNRPLELKAHNRAEKELTIKVAISAMTIQGATYFSFFMNDITARRKAEEAVRRSLKEKEVLLKEIHHRVKNNLQVITSLLSLQASFIDQPSIADIFKKSQYRINSMGMVHEMLYQSRDLSKINYGEYLYRLITGLIRAMKGEQARIQLQLGVPEIFLNVDTAIPLSLIINEVVTNSLKYGFPDEMPGMIYVQLMECATEDFVLHIGDDGVGYEAKPLRRYTTPSLGLSLMQKLAIQLKGSIRRLTEYPGTHYRLQFQEITQ